MNGIQENQRSESVQDVTVPIGIETERPFRRRKRRDFYVYVYLDPRKPGKFVYGEYEFDYEPFYAGKGHGKRTLYFTRKHNGHLNNKLKTTRPEIVYLINTITEEKAFEKEIQVIQTIGRADLGKGPLLNKTNGGEGTSGIKKIISDETRRKIGIGNKGKIISEEVKLKISISLKGKKKEPFTEKHKANMRKAAKNRPPVSDKTRMKLSEAGKKRKCSEETKRKLSLAQKGKRWEKLSEETKRKISLALKGKKKPLRSKEHSKNISEGLLQYNKNKKGQQNDSK